MANLLDKITSLDFLKKGEGVLGVDIGSSAIKIVHVKDQRGKLTLENYGALALGPYAGLAVGQATILPKEKIIEALIDLMNEMGVDTKRAALAIPLKDSMITVVEMPDMGEDQLKTMVPLEARKHIPVAMSEVTLNFWIMPVRKTETVVPPPDTSKEGTVPEKSKKQVEVLLAAIHNNSIAKYRGIQSGAALDAKLFEIEIFSTMRSLVGADTSSVMILDIGSGTTKISMMEYGVLMSSHTVNRGSQDITTAISKAFGLEVARAEEIKRDPSSLDVPSQKQFSEVVDLTLNHIFSEANGVLLDYQKKYNKAVSKVVLSGGGVLVSRCAERTKDFLKIDVVLGDPFARVDTPTFLKETLKHIGPEFAVAVGLALEASS